MITAEQAYRIAKQKIQPTRQRIVNQHEHHFGWLFNIMAVRTLQPHSMGHHVDETINISHVFVYKPTGEVCTLLDPTALDRWLKELERRYYRQHYPLKYWLGRMFNHLKWWEK